MARAKLTRSTRSRAVASWTFASLAILCAALVAMAWFRGTRTYGMIPGNRRHYSDHVIRQDGARHFAFVSYNGLVQIFVGILDSTNYPPPQGWSWERVGMSPGWPHMPTTLGFGYEKRDVTRPGFRELGHQFVFPWLLPLGFFAFAATMLTRRALAHTRRLRNPRRCPACGYDLRATPDRCPECGNSPAADAHPPSSLG